MHKLYHYVPKDIDVSATGLLTPISVPRSALSHYFGRAKCHTKKGVLTYLESLFPGRSRAISFLTGPLTESCCFYRDFQKDRRLYSVCFESLNRAGLIESIYRIDGPSYRQIGPDGILWHEVLPWDRVGSGFFFSRIPHYMIVLKTGSIPPDLITEEQSEESAV